LDANGARDWRIHAAFAEHLIAQARKLHLGDTLFEKMPIQQAFADNDPIQNQGENSNQMNLFAF